MYVPVVAFRTAVVLQLQYDHSSSIRLNVYYSRGWSSNSWHPSAAIIIRTGTRTAETPRGGATEGVRGAHRTGACCFRSLLYLCPCVVFTLRTALVQYTWCHVTVRSTHSDIQHTMIYPDTQCPS